MTTSDLDHRPPRAFAIVPAAGRSVRMGRPKLLLPWGEATVIEAVLRAWNESRVSRTVVVVRADDDELAEVCRACGAEVVRPELDPPDMKASVAHALLHVDAHHAPAAGDAWLLAPADMPQLSTTVIDLLIAEHERRSARINDTRAGDESTAERNAILAPAYNRRRGHPVLFPWPLSADVFQLAEDEGVSSLAQRNVVVEVETPEPSILNDLDTPADYQRLRNP